jgi:hypothetical protein
MAAVAQQPLAPVFIAGVQGLLDQQAPETRAVDEQVAGHGRAAVQRDRLDEAVLAAQVDLDDLGVDASHAVLLGDLAHQPGEQAGVEVQGPVEHRQGRGRVARRGGELAAGGQAGAQRIVADRRGFAQRPQAHPVVMERHALQVLAVKAEGVDEGRAGLEPVVEADAQLAGAAGGPQHVDVGQTQGLVEAADGRDRRLAHADRADLGGLDQGDLDRRRAESAASDSRPPSSPRCPRRR